MSDPKLPTLYAHPWTLDHNLDKLVPLSREPIDGKPNVAYVPASALDAANEALRMANDENKRLRAAIESVEHLQRWANEMTHYHKGEWVLYEDVIAALSPRPGAKESADE